MQQRVGGCHCLAVIHIAPKLVRFRMLRQQSAGKITCGRREGDLLSGAKKKKRFCDFLGGFFSG